MTRPSRALGLAALLVAGLSVSVGVNAAGTTGSDTTEPTATSEAVETTEPTETSEVVDTTGHRESPEDLLAAGEAAR